MTALERRFRWLLHAYPAWYRRERAGEMLDTLLEASPPVRRWPSIRDSRALVVGGLRVRGLLAWCVSILWAALGAAGAGYTFVVSAHRPDPYSDVPADWIGEPNVIFYAAFFCALAWLVLTIPVLNAGCRRLRDADGLRGAWATLWLAGIALMVPVASWHTSAPEVWSCTRNLGCAFTGYKYAVVSWGQLAVLAGYLAVCAAMILILRRPAGRQLSARYTPDGAVAGQDVTRPA